MLYVCEMRVSGYRVCVMCVEVGAVRMAKVLVESPVCDTEVYAYA